MKKLLLSMLTMALMVVSCQRDADLDATTKEPVLVTIGVGLPDVDDATRSGETGMDSGLGAITNFSEDEWAEYDLRYMLEVYDVLTNTLVKVRDVKTCDAYEPTFFELRLIPERTYKFVVWADLVLEGTDTDLNYNTADFTNITRMAAAEGVAMDECLDAYFIQEEIYIVNSLPRTLTLTRPFGKLRVITTDIDQLNLGSVPEKVVVNFYNHPIFASLNALTGQASSNRANLTYEYNVAKDAPYTEGYDALTQNQTLYADYLLASDDCQEINFTMEVYEAGDRLMRMRDFNTQIPLERNKLTTIIGNLLTTHNEFQIIIDDTFEGEYVVDNIWDGNYESLPAVSADGFIEIETPGQLATVLGSDPDGIKVRLMQDINFGGMAFMPYSNGALGNNAAFEFDGNGKVISNYAVNSAVSAGLFANLVNATIYDLTLRDAVVKPSDATRASGDFYAGALVGRTYGACAFDNITVENADVEGVNKVGGLIGNVAEGTITVTNCVVEGSTVTTLSTEDGGCLGGIVGYVTGNAKFENNAVRNTTINAINSANEAKRANAEFIGAFHGSGKTITLNQNTCSDNTFNQAETSYVAPEGFYPWLGGVRYMDGSDVVVDGESLVVKEAVQLGAPSVEATVEKSAVTLSWTVVENAGSYSITVGTEMPVFTEELTYTFTGEFNTEYTFAVAAVPSDEAAYSVSEATMVTATTEVAGFSFENVNSDFFSFTLDIIPDDKDAPYIVMLASASYIIDANIDTPEKFYNDDCSYFTMLGGLIGKSAVEVMNERAKTGDLLALNIDNAVAGMTYTCYCYYFDTETGALLSDIYVVDLTTMTPEKIDVGKFNIGYEFLNDGTTNISVTPESYEGAYYYDRLPRQAIDNMLVTYDFLENDVQQAIEYWWNNEVIYSNHNGENLSPEQLIAAYGSYGSSSYAYTTEVGTEYYVFAFALDENALVCSEPQFISYVDEEPAEVEEYIYLKPNSNWTQANARFAVYSWNDGGDMWVDMADSDGDGIYEIAKSALNGNTNIIFCRMNPSATANNWNNKWNQTADLTVPTDGTNLYTVANGTWDNGGGTWSKM